MYPYTQATGRSQATAPRVSSKSPRINWVELHRWYQAILTAGQDWRTKVQRCRGTPCKNLLTADIEVKLEAEFTESRKHLWKTLFKSTEVLLRRPGRPLKTLTDCRFLLLLLENPLLYSIRSRDFESEDDVRIKSHNLTAQLIGSTGGDQVSSRSGPNTSRSHIGVIKRLFGLMATLSPENHRHIVSWFTRYTRADFGRLVDLVGCFVTQRLMRQRQGSQGTQAQDSISVLVPEISRSGAGTPAQLHAALGPGTKPSSSKALDGRLTYGNDWQIKAAAKIMSLLFEANNSSAHRHHIVCEEQVPGAEGPTPGCQSMSGPVRHTADALINATDRVSLLRACKRQRQLPTNAFYNTLLDYCDLVADFETWENRRASFSFCQYPMFLSVWAKIRILEYDARRQMEVKARQAFFNSIINRHAVSQYLVLRVRRECLVEDSLRGVSEAVGSGQEDIKKGLRIAFQGEEGVDAGGLVEYLYQSVQAY